MFNVLPADKASDAPSGPVLSMLITLPPVGLMCSVPPAQLLVKRKGLPLVSSEPTVSVPPDCRFNCVPDVSWIVSVPSTVIAPVFDIVITPAPPADGVPLKRNPPSDASPCTLIDPPERL